MKLIVNTPYRFLNTHYTNTDERTLLLADYLIENRATLRATARVFGISKSTVHKDLTHHLPHISKTLYIEVKKILNQNRLERHLRGGEATKNKYLQQKSKRT